MQFFISILIGKTIKNLLKLFRKRGSALPGLVVEKFNKNILKQIFKDKTVIIVSGTNGKTTTTKIITEILSNYFKVFSNTTGSNFTRGIISEYISLKDRSFEIAVLELDEARAIEFINKVPPNYSVLLNVLRDQLDRFGEIDTTLNYLREIALKTVNKVLLNKNDNLIFSLTKDIKKKKVEFFSYQENLSSNFSSDDELYKFDEENSKKTKSNASNKKFGDKNFADDTTENLTTLIDFKEGFATIKIEGISNENIDENSGDKNDENIDENNGDKNAGNSDENNGEKSGKQSDKKNNGKNDTKNDLTTNKVGIKFETKLKGVYNALNLTASIGLIKIVLRNKFDINLIKNDVKNIKPAFGRGESISYKDKNLNIILVKNPSGFNIALKNFANTDYKTAIFLNDEYADGRDVSWIYDVDFSSLEKALVVSGSRCYDLALRLTYDDIEVKNIFSSESEAVDLLLNSDEKNINIYATYTAMLKIRKYLSNKINLKEVI